MTTKNMTLEQRNGGVRVPVYAFVSEGLSLRERYKETGEGKGE